LIFFIIDIIVGDMDDHGTDEEWTDLMDRDGLIHVKDLVHQLICAMEAEMQSHLNALTSFCSSDTTTTISHVEYHEDVHFYWQIVMAEFEIEDSEVHSLLLHQVVELFFTIHGHSKVSACMEHYKQLAKSLHNFPKAYVIK